MGPGWSHNDVFPCVANAIEAINSRAPGFADHEAIVEQLLQDPQALKYIEAALDAEQPDATPTKIADNMVAWFSQRITIGTSPWAARFNRQKIGGAWAYRIADRGAPAD